MRYDFTTILDRRGMDSVAVEPGPERAFGPTRPGFSQIPMWVADMGFATVPTVQQAITRRVAHGAFGYFLPRPEYYRQIIRWQERRNGVTGLEPRHIGYENGVLGGAVSVLRALCGEGDPILVHSPTYIGFTGSLGGRGWRLVTSPLRRDAAGVWRMDFADMEEKLRREKIHAAVLCSPHNPTGRVWERWELEQAMELFRRYDVRVVSDEIWSDLTLAGYRHIPTQSVSADARARTAAFYAPSKTFNLAGLVGSYHIIYDSWLRDRAERESAATNYNEMNLLSMYALLGAYCPEGEAWLEELRQVLSDSAAAAVAYIRARFEGVEVAAPQGTYMLFLDCTDWCRRHGKTLDELLAAGHAVGVLWQDGRPFHGPCHIRMNLAQPRSLVDEALDRLDRYVFNA